MNRLVLIDGHAILYRAYHALPPLITHKGQMVNAVYGFTSMLLRVLAELKPSHLVVVFDTPEPTFRNKLYKEYQAQRPKADDEFIAQIDIVKRLVSEMGIPIFEKAGFEADDVIGTIKRQAQNQKENIEVIIVTGDKDILQLVNDQVRIYMPVKGLSQSKLYGEKEVVERMGVAPSQVVDYKALVGDPSDNYPGIAGIGPKTAAELLTQFGTLENLYGHLEKIAKESLRRKLEEGKESALISKTLATIIQDVPVEFALEKCKLPDLDKINVHLFLDELEFRSLIPRLSTKNNKPASPAGLPAQASKKQKEKKEEITHQQTSLF